MKQKIEEAKAVIDNAVLVLAGPKRDEIVRTVLERLYLQGQVDALLEMKGKKP